MKITTKCGDDGESGLMNGERRIKSDAVFDVLGDLDELNSFLGSVKIVAKADYIEIIEVMQKKLYEIMGIVSNDFKTLNNIDFGEKDIDKIDDLIENFCSGKALTKFVLPGNDDFSARLHVSRTVCRRAERAFVRYIKTAKEQKYSENENVKNILIYLNRLSDLLFAMSV